MSILQNVAHDDAYQLAREPWQLLSKAISADDDYDCLCKARKHTDFGVFP